MAIPALPTHLWEETQVIGGSHKTQWCGAFVFALLLITFALLNNLLDKQSSCQWLKMPWRLCHFTVLTTYVNSAKYFKIVNCLAAQITKVPKAPGHQHVWCRQCKINTELIWGIVTPHGIINLLNNGPGNSLLSGGAKPLHDPMLTFHQYAPMWLLSIQVMTYIDDENKFEWILFKMSPGFFELRDLSGKALYVQILLILTQENFIEWIFPFQIQYM